MIKTRNIRSAMALSLAMLLLVGCFTLACTGGASLTISEAEESGEQLGLDETYDSIRNGGRLIMIYDAPSNSFTSTVENTTEKILKEVRVEVYLSNDVELGPTQPTDLKPGEKNECLTGSHGRGV